ncbi:hypothetical protein KIS4809_1424 [Bacillus sp. ZZV12-4809]|nr:hypothetical protein KIS4809_1424 [Bacillus sp. ZZV12-4809]
MENPFKSPILAAFHSRRRFFFIGKILSNNQKGNRIMS